MRTVLAVDPFVVLGGGAPADMVAVRVEKAPFAVPQSHVSYTLPLAPGEFAAWGTPSAVRARGTALRDRLRQHPGVAGVLDSLATVPHGTSQPLYVKLSEGEAELISWETLCDAAGEFIALDRRWPIGRISDPTTAQARPPAALRLPVKMLAVISAFGIPAQRREWELCRDAVAQACAAGLPLALKVLVGDAGVRAAIDADIAAGLTGVEVSHVEATGSRLVQEIVAWEPNVIHFFCHGVADGSDQVLELATAADFADPGATGGSVRVHVRQLVGMATTLSNPWLLVLNCCSSGQAARELHSLAHQVVSAGVPAAVAMAEPVDASDANEFTRAFYAAAFARLLQAHQALAAAPRVPFEWVDAMYDARSAILALHADDADNRHEWALPVLYVRGVEPLHFERPAGVSEAAAVEHRLKARLVAEWLQSVGEETALAQRQAVMQRLLAGVPASYWPNPDGSFGDA